MRNPLTAATGLVAFPVSLLRALEQELRNLGPIATGVEAMHGEFVGMRKDILALSDQVEGLRGEVAVLNAVVADMRADVGTINGQIGGLTDSLAAIDALASRFGWMAPRRSRRAAAAVTEPGVAPPAPPDSTD